MKTILTAIVKAIIYGTVAGLIGFQFALTGNFCFFIGFMLVMILAIKVISHDLEELNDGRK